MAAFAMGARPGCVGDFNYDGAVDDADLHAFLAAFIGGVGDVNHDGGTDSNDMFDFLDAMGEACP